MKHSTIKNNFSESDGVRRVVHEGMDTLVVPVVMIVDGVLNGALVTAEEYGKFVDAWNGIPVPVLHPERDGQPVSANQPDIIESNTIGRIYNSSIDNGRLKGEAWLNVGKAQRLGYGDMIDALEAGVCMEVSTGYYADDDASPGEYNGERYDVVHRNIRPDHLALLPGQIGACSVADGCGTRVNKQRGVVMSHINKLAEKLGIKKNDCGCSGGDKMKCIKDKAKSLVANEKLTPKQFEMLAGMDEEQLKMVAALVEALAEGIPAQEPEEEPVEMMGKPAEEKAAQMALNHSDIDKIIDKIVANKVSDHLRRESVMAKLTVNEKCPFNAEELKAMSIQHLEKLEQSIRVEDYSGRGGFALNSSAIENTVQPLLPMGVLKKEDK